MWPNLPAWHKREFAAAERASMKQIGLPQSGGRTSPAWEHRPARYRFRQAPSKAP
jgi:hypothetical protein